MPDAFFASTKNRKRKRPDSNHAPRSAKKPYRNAKASAVKGKRNDQERLSDHTDDDDNPGDIDDMDLRADDIDPAESGEEDDNETPAEKRLRLARMYLETVKTDLADGEFDARDVDRELISARLKQDVLEHAGKIHLFLADSFDFSSPSTSCLRTRGHRFSITSARASESSRFLFTTGKDGSIIKWDLSTGKRLATIHKIRPPVSDVKGKSKALSNIDIKGHTDEILSLALSGDERFLVTSGRDHRICVWNQDSTEWVKTFSGPLAHRDAVSGLAFRKGTNQLYSSSFDRTVKVYDLSPGVMGYVETLFGHQDQILSLDALRGETCVSIGGRDRTARYWKIADETQLVFRGGGRSRIREVLEGGLKGDGEEEEEEAPLKPKLRQGQSNFVEGSLESIAMIDETTFITGGDSGSISLWSTTKKKPIFTQPVAHGFTETETETGEKIQTARWVTSLSSLRYSDIFASGSWDGQVRLWKLEPNLRSFSLIGTIPIPGVVNSLQLVGTTQQFLQESQWVSSKPESSSNTKPFLLVAGVGQEHRLGRWIKVQGKNSGLVFAFSPRTLV